MTAVDDAFQSLLKHFDREDALGKLKQLRLWGHKEGRWFETDMDQ